MKNPLFDSLVWGSLRLAPTKQYTLTLLNLAIVSGATNKITAYIATPPCTQLALFTVKHANNSTS